jgi:acetoin utilization deacetylase AcuC-like enzyme
MMPATLAAARRGSGAAIAAVDGVLAGDFDIALCATRPPGHHAERATAMGFCFFNHVAVAALQALEAHGLERVAICDFDVHHGNGTEDIFDGDPRVLFCSTFQHPFYPGKAGPTVPGQRVNCPLPAGTDGAGVLAAIENEWLPALDDFAPQLLLISAGFGAHAADPIGGMRLTEADFARITRDLVEVAQTHTGGRIVSQLEGGYALDALGRSVAAHLAVLLE